MLKIKFYHSHKTVMASLLDADECLVNALADNNFTAKMRAQSLAYYFAALDIALGL